MMNKIAWNRVTWYSKIVAMALFVALPFIGFYYGVQYGTITASLGNGLATSTVAGRAASAGVNGEEYYKNVAEWQTNRDENNGFSIAYPIDFDTQGEPYTAALSTNWRAGANGVPGTTLFTLAIPRAFEPQTNFNDAKLVVGASRVKTAIAQCLMPDPSGGSAVGTSTVIISGVPFTVFHSADAGAGNYYETTSYRVIHGGQCYAIEYTLHSGQIMNYPVEYHLRAFDRAKLTDLLDRIAGTFKFLE